MWSRTRRTGFEAFNRAVHQIQALEPRVMLSVSSTILSGPDLSTGNSWTYSYNNSDEVDVVNAVSATTFNGQAAEERDTTEYDSGLTGGVNSVAKDFYGITSAGLVDFTQTNTSYGSSGSVNVYNSHMYDPAEVIFPPTLNVGQPVTVTTVDTFTTTNYSQDGQITTVTRNITNTGTLVSDTPVPLAVPAGTFNCYQIQQTLVWVQNGATTTINETVYVATGVGIVEINETDTTDNGNGGGGSGSSIKMLSAFTADDRLVFTQQPSNVQGGDPIKPAITVSVEDSNGDVSADASGTVTLAIIGVNDNNPISGNTATLVNGVATFSDVELTQAGVYTLQASDTDNDTVGNSNKFGVGGDKLIFLTQPKPSHVTDPLIVKVEALTSKGKKDTTLADTLELDLNVISGGTDATLSGTNTLTFVGGVASFPASADVSINSPGVYALTATAMNSDGIDPTVTAVTSSNFKIESVTLKSITVELGTQKKTTEDDDLTITDSNVFAVLESDDEMSLSAAGLSPSTSKILAKIGWAVQRNTDDIAAGATPTVAADEADPLDANVSLNGVGSFNVICYYDTNDNGSYDAGEELQVFHLAEVGINVIPSESSETTSNNNFSSEIGPTKTSIISGDFKSNPALLSSETVQVIGGGADGMIGVSKIHLGFLQNGLADTAMGHYQNGKTQLETLKSGRFPVLDANYPPNARIPYVIFVDPTSALALDPIPNSPGPTRDPEVGSDPNGGQDRLLTNCDSPLVQFSNKLGTSPLISTSGFNDFALYLSAYSDDCNKDYVTTQAVDWSAQFTYSKDSNGIWQNAGSTVDATVTPFAVPVTLASLGVKTTGPIFTENIKLT